MSARNHDRTTKQDLQKEQAIGALITHGTVKQAAQSVGVAEATLRRWLRHDTAFQAEYQAARRAIYEEAVNVACIASRNAVACLVKNLSCGNPSSEIRAALGLLQTVSAGLEMSDVLTRLAALEATQDSAE